MERLFLPFKSNNKNFKKICGQSEYTKAYVLKKIWSKCWFKPWKMTIPAAATKIRNFLVWVVFSTLKSTFFRKFLDGRIEFIVKSMFQKKSGRNVDLNPSKLNKQTAATQIRALFVWDDLRPLKLTFFHFFYDNSEDLEYLMFKTKERSKCWF